MALGSTRWEMVRGVAIPQVSAGLVAAVILGLARALGEAIAVSMVIGNSLGRPLVHIRRDRHACQPHREPVPGRRHRSADVVAGLPGGDPPGVQPGGQRVGAADRAPHPTQNGDVMSAEPNPLTVVTQAIAPAQAGRSLDGGDRDRGRGAGRRRPCDRGRLGRQEGPARRERRLLHQERRSRSARPGGGIRNAIVGTIDHDRHGHAHRGAGGRPDRDLQHRVRLAAGLPRP